MTPEYPTNALPFSVPFAHRVVFTHGLFNLDNDAAAHAMSEVLGGSDPVSSRGIIAFIDDGFHTQWPDFDGELRGWLQAHLPNVELRSVTRVPGGESCKQDMQLVDQVIEAVERWKIDRRSAVLAVGGGAVLDAVGLGAALSHRGVRHIRVPTSVLAQDDAGMGVKNGINRFGKKNFVGSFSPPDAVLCDLSHTRTLSVRHRRAGLSEAVKIFALRDPHWFAKMESSAIALRDGAPEALEPVIVQSAHWHVQHIVRGGDPFERLAARPLDFGHWSAHRLESLSQFEIPHGEAVSIGIALDCHYARLAGLMSKDACDRVVSLLRTLGLPTFHPLLEQTAALIPSLEEFREHLGGQLTITLLREIGESVDVHAMETALLERAVLSLKAESSSK
ncbi:MAG: 3-dehydroquinate synthase [Planctomycetota bacterium]|nr:3-dehydroquinate synthase [Planctomycetota bacterium]